VRVRRGDRAAHYEHDTDTIALPNTRNQSGLRQVIVLHELAHKDTHGHGPEFCTRFLNLVQQEMGPEAHFLLRAMFYENGVDI
jgi:putative metallohydrolase (TIGR04338 family)